jgi:hypothetical protein
VQRAPARKCLCARIERPRFCLLTLINGPGSVEREVGRRGSFGQ